MQTTNTESVPSARDQTIEISGYRVTLRDAARPDTMRRGDTTVYVDVDGRIDGRAVYVVHRRGQGVDNRTPGAPLALVLVYLVDSDDVRAPVKAHRSHVLKNEIGRSRPATPRAALREAAGV